MQDQGMDDYTRKMFRQLYKEYMNNRDNGRFCDVDIETADEDWIPFYKNLLAVSCGYFNRELSDHTCLVPVTLKTKDFEIIIEYLFTGEIELTADNFSLLYSIAKTIACHNLMVHICYFVRDNYNNLWFSNRDTDLLSEVLQHDFINVDREDIIFDSIVAITNISDKEREKLVNLIRFHHLSDDYLLKISAYHPAIERNQAFRKTHQAKLYRQGRDCDQNLKEARKPLDTCDESKYCS